MGRSRRKKKGSYSQEVKLLATLLSIVVVVAAICVAIDKKDDEKEIVSSVVSSASSDESYSSVNQTVSGDVTISSSQNSGSSDVVSGSADISSSSENSTTVDISLVFDDTDKVGNTPDSWNLLLVNANNVLDKEYVPELHSKRISGVHDGGYQISTKIYDAYTAMVSAAKKDGVSLVACSIYRQYSSQERNYNNRVTKLMNQGLSRQEAEAQAATVIARPGTSEHQTGMAVDFNPCTDAFESSAGYKWLCDNAEDYGFIQRYKAEKSAITGIIDEPWHYRYVGVEHAKKINELNICLEEYIEYLKN